MNSGRLKEVAAVFLKLGVIAFGGPAAHIAMMEEEVVNKRKWITREYFLDLIGATNLIPGPNSTEMTMHCGHERAGIPGLFVAGICFILPAAFITSIFAWFYVEYGKLPLVEPFFYGIKPAIIAIIISAIYNLGKKSLKNRALGVIGAVVILLSFVGVNEIYALLGAGVIAIMWFSGKDILSSDKASAFSPLFIFSSTLFFTGTSLGGLFLIFFKIGATLYGSGYVLVAYLQAELIDKTQWITQQQLLDAVAIGQFTPGPLFTTATFIGYQIAGFWGALVATAGIFLPSFLFVLLINPIIPKLRNSKIMASFLDGVNIGAIAIMITVTFELGSAVLTDWKALLIFGLSLLLVFGYKKLNMTWIVLGGALSGYLLDLF
ncbi:MAG TPA: chromate efflux transporter [Cytophagales bacterium]|nr:chromate efflux transporter [Cytophagales bacterium]